VKNKYALLLFLLAIGLFCRAASGDIVRLNDGRSYEGEIVEETDETIKIKLDLVRGSGYVTVRRDEIRRRIAETPQEREGRLAEMMTERGFVKDGDEWVTPEEKAARDAQRQAEQEQIQEQRAPYRAQMEKLKQEQRERQQKEQDFKDRLNRSGEESTATLRDITLKLIFFVILGIIAFTLLKRYFWD
jgi:hypothetical protein